MILDKDEPEPFGRRFTSCLNCERFTPAKPTCVWCGRDPFKETPPE